MKRLLSLILCVVLCAALAAPVFADLLWVPENDFLQSHETEFVNRAYVVNSPAGSAWVYEDPESGKAIAQALNGTIFVVTNSYQGQWGIVVFTLSDGIAANGYDQTGWIKLEDCYLRYDSDSFYSEYGGQFQSYPEAVEAFGEALEVNQTLQFYSYPGSGEITSWLPIQSEDLLNEIKNTFRPDEMFLDENGLYWGSIGYFQGRRDWLCFSDPTNENLPDMQRATLPTIYPAKKSDLTPEEASPSPKTGEQTRNLTIAGVLVAAVAAVSGVLIARLKKKTA